MQLPEKNSPRLNRLVSLDVFRGITMFLLVAESARIYSSLGELAGVNSFFEPILQQFEHHEWHGLRFWDFVQPYFMFIVGVAMAFSLERRQASGATWLHSLKHILYRCGMLLLFGVGLHCVYNHRLVWELWNVLAQLSFTILVAYLIIKLPVRTQLGISFGLLLLTEILYRFTGIPGFDHPFVKGENFGSWMDMLLMGKINGGGWVAVNAIPTAAHTIWGVLAGKLLLGSQSDSQKLKILLIGAVAGLVIGYGLDWTGVTPIIKRICTSSFVIVTGGWCLLTLGFFYWLVDLKGVKGWTPFFTIVGMNPIFIYLLTQTVGGQWVNGFVAIFTTGFMGWFGLSGAPVAVVSAFAALALYWYLCYWLYQRKIIIKI